MEPQDTVRHVSEHFVRAITVSDDLRMAVKLDTPTLLIEYTEIPAARRARVNARD